MTNQDPKYLADLKSAVLAYEPSSYDNEYGFDDGANWATEYWSKRMVLTEAMALFEAVSYFLYEETDDSILKLEDAYNEFKRKLNK